MNRLGTFGIDWNLDTLKDTVETVTTVGKALTCIKETEEIDKLKTQRMVFGLGGVALGVALGIAYSKFA